MNKSIGAILFTLMTLVLPLMAAVVAFPYLIHSLGVEKFGILSIFWVLIGYFSIFDLGLGRVMTREVSVLLGQGQIGKLRPTVTYLLRLMFILSAFGAAIVTLISVSPFVSHFATSEAAASDIAGALRWLALGLPAVILFSAVRGLLEALQNFRTAATLRSIIGTWTFAGPVVAVQIDDHLETAIMLIALFRIAALALPFLLIYRIARTRGYLRTDAEAPSRGLFQMAGWMSVSNVVSPVLVYLDRFLLASSAGPAAVAYYSAPFDILSRLSVFPEAIFSVLFPKIARYHSAGSDTLVAAHLVVERILLLFIVTVAALSLISGEWALSVWLGPEFAANSYQLLLLLLAGLVPNFTARAAFNTLQAAGHAKATAVIHLVELPVYLVLVTILIGTHGAAGAALAWSLRALLDFLLLRHVMGRRISPALRNWPVDAAVFTVCTSIAGTGILSDGGADPAIGIVLLAICLVATGVEVRRLLAAPRSGGPND